MEHDYELNTVDTSDVCTFLLNLAASKFFQIEVYPDDRIGFKLAEPEMVRLIRGLAQEALIRIPIDTLEGVAGSIADTIHNLASMGDGIFVKDKGAAVDLIHCNLVSRPFLGLPGIWTFGSGPAHFVYALVPGSEPRTYHMLCLMIEKTLSVILPKSFYVDAENMLLISNRFYGTSSDGPNDSMSGITDEKRKGILDAFSLEKVIAILHLIAIAQLVPEHVKTHKVPQRLAKAAKKRNRPKPKRVSTISLPGLRYDSKTRTWKSNQLDSQGRPLHIVRGYYKRLESERFVNRRGEVIWVDPYRRGDRELGTVTHNYVIDKPS